MYTCNTCSLQFPTPDDQRAHMKSDWHRYNLKRRVASLPAINEDLFNEKVQKLTINDEQEDTTQNIKTSNKQMTKKEQRKKEKEALLEKKRQLLELARENMLKSIAKERENKDQETETETEIERTQDDSSEINVTAAEAKTEEATEINEAAAEAKIEEATEIKESSPAAESSTDQEIENLTDEQLAERILSEKLKNKVEIPLETCLFCNKNFPEFEECITHMHKNHGFYIPEQKYLVDMEGLVKYMAEKIGLGNVCISCNFQGRSIHAVRAHMIAKRHCNIPYDSEDEKLEISEFYDFSSTYSVVDAEDEWEDVEDGEEVAEGEEDEEESLPEQVSYNDGVELHLPSGIKIGHRSLARYFKQNLKPERVLSEGQGTVIAAESRHMVSTVDRVALLEKKRIWKTEKSHQDRDDRRAAKFINNQPYYRDQLLQ